METGISNYLLTQGVLGVACLVLGIVVIYQQRKADRKDSEAAAEIKALNALLISEAKQHAKDYQEISKDNVEVMLTTSQNVRILSEKIEIGKRQG